MKNRTGEGMGGMVGGAGGRSRAGRLAAFTLIELLVVVVIITVLMAILLPSLGKARQQAKRTACAALLKGLGAGVRTYLDMNSNVLPNSAEMPSVDSAFESIMTTLVSDVPNPKSWKCPADTVGYTQIANGKGYPTYFAGEGTSYGYNPALRGLKTAPSMSVPVGIRVLDMADQSVYVLFDLTTFHGARYTLPSVNVLYADGHVGDVSDISQNSGKPRTH